MPPITVSAAPARRRPTSLVAVLGLLAAVHGTPVAPATATTIPLDPACAVPDPLLALPGSLDHLVGRARSGAAVKILAIGSSSTQGHGASTPSHSYPARLAAELNQRLPKLRVTVLNRGVGGEVAASTVRRLLAEAKSEKPDLVIWQVGTNDAVRGVASVEMAKIIETGIDFLRSRGIDVLLMDPQFFPRIAGDAAYAGVVARIGALALDERVPVLRRYEAMRHWASVPNPASMLYTDAFHMNDLGYACVAEVLAEGLARRVEAAASSDPAITAGMGGSPAPSVTPAAEAEGSLTH